MTNNDRRSEALRTLWDNFFQEHTRSIVASLCQFDYVSALARRSFNLLFAANSEALLTAEGARNSLMTDNALLLQHDKIAAYYRENGRFPRILLTDDVLIHGRGLSRLLEDLWALLLEDLMVDGPLDSDQIYNLHRDFLRAVELRVYARNKREIILCDSYRRRLSWQRSLYAAELREFAGVSCDALYADERVVNTSFVFSSLLPGLTDTAPDGWERVVWRFEEKFNTLEEKNQVKGMTVYVRRPKATASRWVSTIRHKDLPGQPSSKRLVTSLVLFGQLPEEDFHGACAQAAVLLDDGRCPSLAVILRQNRPQLERVRMQLLSFFASVITFFDFAQGLFDSTEQILADSDLDKISLNFGSYSEIYPELRTVCGDVSLREALRKIIFSCLDRCSPLKLPASTPPSAQRMERITEAGKSVMGRLGGQSEEAAYRPGPLQDDRKIGQISFSDYLTQVRQIQPSGGWVNEIAAFLFLMESGIMGMNIYPDSEEGALCCIAKAGEKATFALAEPIAVELPALALVERECWRLSLEPMEALERFIPLLTPDEEAQRELLDACRRLYQCGHSLTGWDFETITEQRDSEKKRRQTAYLAQARAFLRMPC